MKRKNFNHKWKEEFPRLPFTASEKMIFCDLRRAYPIEAQQRAGNTKFFKGCSNFKKEMVRKHANSNGHIRAKGKLPSKSIVEARLPSRFQN